MAPAELLFGDEICTLEFAQIFVDRIKMLWNMTRATLKEFVTKQASII